MKVINNISEELIVGLTNFIENSGKKLLKTNICRNEVYTKLISCLICPDLLKFISEKGIKILLNKINLPAESDKVKNIINLGNYFKSNPEIHKNLMVEIFQNNKPDIKYLEEIFVGSINLKTGFQNIYKRSKDMTLDEIIEYKNTREKIIKERFVKYGLSEFKKKLFKYKDYKNNVSSFFLNFSILYNSILSSNLSKEMDNITKDIFDDVDNIYKSKVDEIYNNTHIGGPYHRLFDESHAPLDMLKKVKEASDKDSLTDEYFNWFSEIGKDIQTTMGIPLISINKETFEKIYQASSEIGLEKSFLYDTLTSNFQELLGSIFSGLVYLIPEIRKDKKKLSMLLGAMASSSILAANPILAILFLIIVVISYVKKEFKNLEKELIQGFIKGASITVIIKIIIFFLTAIELNVLIGLLAVFLITIFITRKNFSFKSQLNKTKKLLSNQLEEFKNKSSRLINNN